MKTHFNAEIQMNLTDTAIMQQKEQTNIVLNQTKERGEIQQHHMEVALI